MRIVDYQPRYQPDFARINKQWIEQYFEMEEEDYKALGHADEEIIGKGGRILLAMEGDKVVGTVALIKMDEDGLYELAKMGVVPEAQGKGIGQALCEAAIATARDKLGAHTLYLGSNSALQTALRLYERLGFKHVKGYGTHYSRCDVQMEMRLR